jgi:aryl-alcohol dehydrogenase-like predicted oxidoreductase
MAEALAGVVHDGRVRAVGVSNYSIKEMSSIHAELERRDVPLATNQVEFGLLRRRPETSGLLGAAAELGVVILAYSPLAQGRLTGKYSAASPPPGRRTFSAHPWELIDPVVAALRAVAETRECAPAQVALAWIIAKGAVPIPGAKNAEQAAANAGALKVDLDGDDLARLDAVALDGTRSLLGRLWQHG